MATWFKLGTFWLPKSNRLDHWSGDKLKKSITTIKTLSSDITIDWGTVQADARTELIWDWMTESDFDTIYNMYETAGATYDFGIHSPYEASGKTYTCEILEFEGTPYQEYYRNVRLVLKLRELQS